MTVYSFPHFSYQMNRSRASISTVIFEYEKIDNRDLLTKIRLQVNNGSLSMVVIPLYKPI